MKFCVTTILASWRNNMIFGFSWLFILVSLSVLGGVVWNIRHDNMAGLKILSDSLEKKIPVWLTFQRWGDPATWAHHTLITIAISIIGAVLAMFSGTAMGLGAFTWAFGATAYYVQREISNIRHHLSLEHDEGGAIWRGTPHYTGWLVDGIGDALFPILYVLWLGTSLGIL